jgi:hypothetical protein
MRRTVAGGWPLLLLAGSHLLLLLLLLLALMSDPANAFNAPGPRQPLRMQQDSGERPTKQQPHHHHQQQGLNEVSRAGAVLGQVGGALSALGALGGLASLPLPAAAEQRQLEYMPGIEGKGYGKPRQVYKDFVQTPSGLQYKDVRDGKGSAPLPGDRVVVDWEGYGLFGWLVWVVWLVGLGGWFGWFG